MIKIRTLFTQSLEITLFPDINKIIDHDVDGMYKIE